jgi:hypothetical protein
MPRLTAVPTSITAAKKAVRRWHRHNKPPVSGLFSVGVALDGELVGVAVAGRPSNRILDDGKTAEITRVSTTEAKNACSFLYGRICRAAAVLGYTKIITYTLAEEPGTSLVAAGFERVEEVRARPTWDTPSRRRTQTDLFGAEQRPPGAKVRWQRVLDVVGA